VLAHDDDARGSREHVVEREGRAPLGDPHAATVEVEPDDGPDERVVGHVHGGGGVEEVAQPVDDGLGREQRAQVEAPFAEQPSDHLAALGERAAARADALVADVAVVVEPRVVERVDAGDRQRV
jgi:hypothetical protein